MFLKFFLLFIIFTPDSLPFDPSDPEVGTYPIYYSQTDEEGRVGTVANFTYVDRNTVLVENLAIYAHDFYITTEDSLIDENIIRFSNAKAWNTTTAENYEIEKVEYSKVSEKQYEATLYAPNSLSIDITITIIDEKAFMKEMHTFNEEYKDGLFIEELNIYILLIFLIIIVIYATLLFLILKMNKEIRNNINEYNRAKTNVKKT